MRFVINIETLNGVVQLQGIAYTHLKEPLLVDSDDPGLSKCGYARIGKALCKVVRGVSSDKKGRVHAASAVVISQMRNHMSQKHSRCFTRMGFMGRAARRSGKKFGRPCGTYKHSDAELTSQLTEVSYPTADVHNTLKVPIRALCQSKRRTAKICGYKTSTFCRRIRRCRLAFTKRPSEKGLCNYCESWRMYGGKQLEHLLSDGMQTINALSPNFFGTFEDSLELALAQRPNLDRVENPDYVNELGKFLDDKADAELPCTGDPLELKSTIKCFADDLKSWMPEVTAINFHRALMRTVADTWKQHYAMWCTNILSLVWDHMAIIIPVEFSRVSGFSVHWVPPPTPIHIKEVPKMTVELYVSFGY